MDDREGVSESLCPYCGEVLDAATAITHDTRPSPGDVSVCWYCAGLLVFDDDHTMREPTDDERAILLAREDVIATIALLRLEGPAGG